MHNQASGLTQLRNLVPTVLQVCALLCLLCSPLLTPELCQAQTRRQQLPTADSLTVRSERPRIGLVLSGGGARGFAHIGVLKMLDSLQVPVDCIAGTSMGGIVAALYAQGYSGREIETLVMGTDWTALFTDQPPRVHLPVFVKQLSGRYSLEFALNSYPPQVPSGLIFGQSLSMLFSNLAFPRNGQIDFDDLPIPFRCVAIDLITGDRVVLHQGSLSKAMCATMAIPSIFSPVAWGDSLLADGAVSNNLPVDIVKEMGADFVIAVDVGAPILKREQLGSALGVLEQWLALAGHDRWQSNVGQTDIMIQIELDDFSVGAYQLPRIRQILDRGEEAASRFSGDLAVLEAQLRQGQWQNDYHHRSISAPTAGDPTRSLPVEFLPQIGDIRVNGNSSYSDRFIKEVLAIKPGDPMDKATIQKGIRNVYALGHFEIIRYEIEAMNDGRMRLILAIKELSSRRLRLGVHYDNYHQLVPLIGVQLSQFLLPGMRLEGDFQFAGLTHARLRTYYPSAALDLPIYPFLDLTYKDISVDLYGHGDDRLSRYRDRSFTAGTGIGLLLSKSLHAEFDYRYEYVNTKPHIARVTAPVFTHRQDKLYQLTASVLYDRLNDVHFPEQGARVRLTFENSAKAMNTECDYRRTSIEVDQYFTFADKHTIRLGGRRYDSTSELPGYKHFLIGGPGSFVGLEYDQLKTGQMTIGQLDYRFRASHEVYLKLMGSMAWNYSFATGNGPIDSDYFWGTGIGMKIRTPAGPIEMIWSLSNSVPGDSRVESVAYFTFGAEL